MSLYEIQGTYTSGTNFTATLHNTELSAIRTAVNNIQNVNVASDAAIAMTKLADFISWSDWTPTFSASGTMTWTGITTEYARYMQIGKLVFCTIWVYGTTGGTLSNGLRFTLPITPKYTDFAIGCHTSESTARRAGVATYGGGYMEITKYDQSNFSATSGCGSKLEFFYEVA